MSSIDFGRYFSTHNSSSSWCTVDDDFTGAGMAALMRETGGRGREEVRVEGGASGASFTILRKSSR